MTDPNLTHIVALLDRSGSMEACRTDTEGGFNAYIAEQREQPGRCTVSLVQFDNEVQTVYLNRPINEVPPLRLRPRGSTALLDALGRTITRTGAALAALPENERPGTVLFVVLTDGYENDSREFTGAQINQMITHQRERYGWVFVFLGANQDAITTATYLGISRHSSITYDTANVGAVMDSVSHYTSAVRNASARGFDVALVAFSDEDREEVVRK